MRIRYTRCATGHLQAIRHFSTRRFGTHTTEATLAKIEVAISNLTDWPGQGRPGRIPGTRERVVPGAPFHRRLPHDH